MSTAQGRSVPSGRDASVIDGSVVGSFPWTVLHERHPALVAKVRDAFPYGPRQHAALDALGQEIADDVIGPPRHDAAEHDAAEHDLATWPYWDPAYRGRRWGEVPFLWAEGYFYRRLLGAVGYFEPGAWRGVDPFEPFKSAELHDPVLTDDLAALDSLAARPVGERDAALLAASLWGNRADLGFRMAASGGGLATGGGGPATSGDVTAAAPLVADDRSVLWELLGGSRPGKVVVVADNAGHELLPDLVLVDHLLATGRTGAVDLHVKPEPYFVSDATTADVVAGLRRLREAGGAAGQVAGRLQDAASTGKFTVGTDDFYCTPLSYRELPAHLADQFAAASVTVMKGDLNYRRLVGDRAWPATTPFEELTSYFPGPVATLRILKSDVVVGLAPRVVERLDATGQLWRTTGAHALVQVRR